MKIGKKIRKSLVNIMNLHVLHDVKVAPGDGVLQALEHHLVDVRRDPGSLDGKIALDFCLYRFPRLHESEACQKHGGQ